MKKYLAVAFLIWCTLGALVIRSQQPASQTAPIFAVNAKYVNGVAPGYWPTAGAGLVLNVSSGTANCAGTIVTYAGGTLTMTASVSNYIYLNTGASCVPAVKTSTFTAADIPIAVVVASGSAITSITDDRTAATTGSSASSPVLSVFTRTGPVTAATNDYTCTQVQNCVPGTSGQIPIANVGTAGLSATAPVSITSAGVISLTTPTGTGNPVLQTSPTLTTPNLGTPSALTLTNATGLPTAGLVNNAVTSAKMAVVNTRRTCDMAIGDTSAGSAITNAQLGPQKRICYVPAASTVVEMDVAADAGTPNVIVAVDHAGSNSNIVSAALATAGSGGIACSNTGGTTGIDGTTTCTNTLQNTSIAAGDYLELVSGTAGGTAKLMTVHVIYTVN